MTPQDIQTALDTAAARLRGGRTHDAVALLQRTVEQAPKVADAHRLLGLGRKALRDYPGAEAALQEAVALDRRNVESLTALADVQVMLGQGDTAEKSYRAALALNRRHIPAAVGLGELLQWFGRAAEALQITTPLVEGSTDGRLLSQHGAALKMLKRYDEALAVYQRAAEAAPGPIADHNVAATLADLGRHAEAEAGERRALAKGLRAPEAHLVLAHALQGQDKLEEAEENYRTAIRLRPDIEAIKDLTHLVWSRTEAVGAATQMLDAFIAAQPDAAPPLLIIRAQVLAHAGQGEASYEALSAAARRYPGDPSLAIAASQQAARIGRPIEALTHAEQATVLAPGDFRALNTLVEAQLGVGEAEKAAAGAVELRRMQPDDQHALALQATAWRLLGDIRYQALYDYGTLVRPYTIDTPEGWPNLAAYLADLAEGLRAMHTTRGHPIGQSLRFGSQTNQSLLNAAHPAVKAFTQAIDGPIHRYIEAIGPGGKHPVRMRNKGGYAVAGIWSVRLRPGGFHIDHVHPEGWLSSACYIELPKAVEGEGRQGWIQFGQPGIATDPPLAAEHFVKPEPGMLVLFPSYMWHGTVPFEGNEPRLTVAFDLVPDKAGRG
jgi:tetratricopeptide (TPR) repeat protein